MRDGFGDFYVERVRSIAGGPNTKGHNRAHSE